MKKTIKKFVLFVFAFIVFIQPGGVFAQLETINSDIIFQPQALEFTGIYDLREIDPNLTGTGVKYAVVCRSFSYINENPQNDYRPAMSHNCFASKEFIFHQDDELPWGISPHSTAICSILFGDDSVAYNSLTGPFYYQGVVPNATSNVFEFWYFVKNNIYYHSPPDADIITAAFGSQFEYWWTRGIESLAEQYGLVIVSCFAGGF